MTITMLGTGVEHTVQDVQDAIDRSQCEEFDGDVRVLFTRAHCDRIVLASEVERLRIGLDRIASLTGCDCGCIDCPECMARELLGRPREQT